MKRLKRLKRKYSREEVARWMSGSRIYINSEDRNIFVRRNGIGSWTMNLGNPWSWVIMGVEVLVIAIVLSVFL